MSKGIILSVILAIIAFSSIGMWGDLLHAGPALWNFAWYLIPVIAFFGFMNDMIKFLRWELYVKRLDLDIPLNKSLMIFISGLSMCATPGKIGLLIKSQMLKKYSGRSLFALTPIIVAELYMDLLGLCAISLLIIGLLGKGFWLAVVFSLLPLLGLSQTISDKLIDLLARLPFLRSRAKELRHMVDDMFSLLGGRTLIMGFFITLIAWTSEGVALHLILKGLGYQLSIVTATAIFGFSTLVGALSMLPGGLIVTDAGLMGLIVQTGVPATPAALATMLARLFTLWLGVLIGGLVLMFNRHEIFNQIQEV